MGIFRFGKEKIEQGYSWLASGSSPYHAERYNELTALRDAESRGAELAKYELRGMEKGQARLAQRMEAEYLHAAQGGYLGKAATAIKHGTVDAAHAAGSAGHYVLSAPSRAGKAAMNYLALGGAVAAGALALNALGFFGGSKKGANSAALDAELEGEMNMAGARRVSAEQALPAPDMGGGIQCQASCEAIPGPMTQRFRPDGKQMPAISPRDILAEARSSAEVSAVPSRI